MAQVEHVQEENKEEDTSAARSSSPFHPSTDTDQKREESIFQAATSRALRPFVIISSSYLLFTITDGAMRMIVLLHAYNKSFSALEVAIMFTLYELAGVFTNLAAGFMGAKWGIKYTLISGLTLQLVSFGYVVYPPMLLCVIVYVCNAYGVPNHHIQSLFTIYEYMQSLVWMAGWLDQEWGYCLCDYSANVWWNCQGSD